MVNISQITLAFLAACLIELVVAGQRQVSQDEWEKYKSTYNKSYRNRRSEERAKSIYAENKEIIKIHNDWYRRGDITYSLAINQFSDMVSDEETITLFPEATYLDDSNEKDPPTVLASPPQSSYDPRNLGLKLNIEDQGTKCSSGWAYAAAKSIELFKATRTGNLNSSSLSAQNLIDCAGQRNACRDQTPQAAFNYLTKQEKSLYLAKDYKNQINLKRPNNCTLPPANGPELPVVNLTAYSKLKYGDDESLKRYVSAGMPVVVEFNPASFHFLHYSDGIFQMPVTARGSHFMVVIGYGTDKSTRKDYWLLQNSFGTSWGIGGLKKYRRSPGVTVAINAIFPSVL